MSDSDSSERDHPSAAPDDAKTVERKDVSDLPEDEVDDEIDQMLQGEEPENTTPDDLEPLDEDPHGGQEVKSEGEPERLIDADEHAKENAPSPNNSDDNRRTSNTQQDEDASQSILDSVDDVSELDPANVSPADLESQEWTLGEESGPELTEVKGTVFKLVEPTDDSVLDIIGEDPNNNTSPSERMRKLCETTVEAPKITDERWSGMKMAEKFQLMLEVSDYLGLQEMMDFQDVGPEALPE